MSGGLNFLDLLNPAEVVCKIVNKAKNLSNKVSLDDVIKIAGTYKKFLPDPKKSLSHENFGMGMTLTNNEVKDIMNVTKSLESTGTLLKGTTRKITS